MSVEVITGDCVEEMGGIEPASFDSVVTDPPYGLVEPRSQSNRLGAFAPRTEDGKARRRGGFMGKAWDAAIPGADVWEEVARVLKPGGYMVAFGGTRTWHRLAVAVEDAGFEIRDTIMWLYGSGFPKGKGCLKPAWEPILLCRKPGPRVLPLGVDECRVNPGERVSGGGNGKANHGGRFAGGADNCGTRPVVQPHTAGRWPANVVHDGSPEVLAAFAEFGERKSGKLQPHHKRGEQVNCYGKSNGAPPSRDFGGDTGTAARFFASCAPTEDEVFIRSAEATIEAWNLSHASTAKIDSSLSSQRAAIALSDAVTLASHGATRLSDLKGLTTDVTPNELKRLGESVIEAILSTGRKSRPASEHTNGFQTRSPAKCAVSPERSDTTTITINHWKSDGSADPVTLHITPNCLEAGAQDSLSGLRFNYCAKASRRERGPDNNHPTVKPLALMRWLVRLVTPPDGLVLDPFGGSGTTGKAAQETGRRAVLIEREPAYAEIARKRCAIEGMFAESAP